MAMTNRDLDATWSYHNSTKHSYDSIHTDAHYLDWENQPLPFKIYQTLDPVALPHDLLSSGVPALSAISAFNPPAEASSIPPCPCRCWPACSTLAPALPSANSIPVAKCSFAPRHARGRCITSSCTWFAATCRSCRRECTTSDQGTSPSVACARAIIASSWCRRLVVNLLWLRRRSPSSAPAPSGVMPGSTRHAPIGIVSGTLAPWLPTCSPCLPRRRCRPKWSWDLSMRLSIVSWG